MNVKCYHSAIVMCTVIAGRSSLANLCGYVGQVLLARLSYNLSYNLSYSVHCGTNPSTLQIMVFLTVEHYIPEYQLIN